LALPKTEGHSPNARLVKTVELPVHSGDAGPNITLTLTYCCSRKLGWAAYLGIVGLPMFPFARTFAIGFVWAGNVRWHGAAEP
jgi:hypothetical protein